MVRSTLYCNKFTHIYLCIVETYSFVAFLKDKRHRSRLSRSSRSVSPKDDRHRKSFENSARRGGAAARDDSPLSKSAGPLSSVGKSVGNPHSALEDDASTGPPVLKVQPRIVPEELDDYDPARFAKPLRKPIVKVIIVCISRDLHEQIDI